VDEAIVEFNSAVALDPENVDARIELGRVYVKQGRPKVAETEFLEAYARGNPDQRAQAEAELQGLFRRLRVDGDFHEVLRARLTASRARQKERVLASRIEGPSLGDLRDLRPIASKIERSALDGKVVVVEVWATWCGPCVRSLRHFDRAWREDYRADAAVEFLTLSTDDDPSLPRGFLEAEQHTVPACQDHGFARRMGVSTYPTTLFFDRNCAVSV
jgi:thiol-disulfide isomerase/thioredoxin